MILVLGGTTEGRKAAEVLEEAGARYFYSTKTGEQDVALHAGERVDGAMDADRMVAFCREHGVRLLVDAAHPFATLLHRTVATAARELDVPVVRYERIFPERDASLTWIDDYNEVPADVGCLLATTGVQSISKLKPLEQRGVRIVYRILPRASSVALAKQQGATPDQLCYYEDGAAIDVEADAILLKESGVSGGFLTKVEAARRRGMRVIVLKRPPYPVEALGADCQERGRLQVCNGPHGLRRLVERLLPEFFPLHSGLTTGTCATAAAVAATRRLLFGETAEEVPVLLPDGETISVAVGYGEDYACCTKVAGDDPDVTDGIEVRVSVSRTEEDRTAGTGKGEQPTAADAESTERITILGGEGVGRFTLPGFDYPPGEPAINRSPRAMIRQNVARAAGGDMALTVTVSIPDGEAIARRTFNPRLGIEGGISVIGVSGIVKPFSEEAFIQSIRKCMEVAKASGAGRVVINSGAKSERFVKSRYPELPRQAFVEYGNYIGETLTMAAELGIPQVTLGVMLGKAVKLAEGHLDTHSRRATMNRLFIASLLEEAGCALTAEGNQYTLARELWDLIPAERREAFARVVIRHCLAHCEPLLPDGQLTILLIGEDGTIYS